MRVLFSAMLCLLSGFLSAQDATLPGQDDVLLYESQGLSIRATPRTPEQMAAFYEARGFPQAMLDLVKEYCFITFRIHNSSQDIVWLDLDDWKFVAPGGEVGRLDRNWWKRQWEKIGAPLASQSTFRWTLIPEVLDYRIDEAEGGNVTLRPTGETFSLVAAFATGADRQGGEVRVRIDKLRCAEDAGS